MRSALLSLASASKHSLTKAASRNFSVLASLSQPLSQVDEEMAKILALETKRQKESINLIPSENFTAKAVLECLGSVMCNKYSEGYPGARYYGGNEFIDMSERLCQQRALALYGLDPKEWGVNVQNLSGSPANMSVYNAVLPVHGRIMSLDLPSGGHLSHGYATATRNVSAVSKIYEVLPYQIHPKTGLIQYDKLQETALVYRPKLLICGASAYSRHIDYAKMREIADSVDALMMMDMAHISGLVAGGAMPSPFLFADIVTTTTHKR
jgi:glycine hydroxymethyltransferase